MDTAVLAEGIYVKRSKSTLGSGATLRECILETHWLPYKIEEGFVELMLVMDNLQRVLGMKERVPLKVFREEYSVKDNSREIYLELKKSVP